MKPGPTARRRASKRRRDLAAQRAVVDQLKARDGVCRLFGLFSVGQCYGFTSPHHLGAKKRAFTRGMAPDERHSPAWECLLCERHHEMVERHLLELDYVDTVAGANGKLLVCDPDGEIVGAV